MSSLTVCSCTFSLQRFLVALAFYEHAITFGVEVQQVWRRDISGATILFLLTRYLTLIDRILAIISLWQLHYLNVCPPSLEL